MELIVRDLRSQVCLGDETERARRTGRPGDLLRDLSAAPRTSSSAASVTTPGPRASTRTSSSAPARIRTSSTRGTHALATDACECRARHGCGRSEADPALHAFREGGRAGRSPAAGAPLIPDDAIAPLMVKIAFVVLPDGVRPRNQDATMLESDVYVRLADPSTPSEGPRCI